MLKYKIGGGNMKIIICGLLTIGLLVCLSTNVGEIPIDKKGMIEIKYVDVVNNKKVIKRTVNQALETALRNHNTKQVSLTLYSVCERIEK